MKKNLVIGSGGGYGWYIWEPFVRSFVKYARNTDLVLFVDKLSDFTRHMLEEVGKEIQGGEIKLVPFPEDLKEGFIVNNRWKMFLRYLENNGNEYNQILVADTRDLIFQDDVFKFFADKKNFIGYTTEADDIRGSKVGVELNYIWITNCFGENEAKRLADKEIICCGTVIGTTEEMKVFLKKMIEYNPNKYTTGNDQVTEQYLIYNDLLSVENIIKIDCLTGAIFTSYLFHEYNPIEIKDSMILRGDGKAPAVVHQYDRQETLINLVDELYRSCDYEPNENFTDVKFMMEQLPFLIKSEKYEFAFKFFANYLLDQSESVKYADEIIRCWEFLSIKKICNPLADMLGLLLQSLIETVFKDGFYINQGKSIVKCLKQCKDNNYSIIADFEDWVRSKIIKAVDWHLEHNNEPRYVGCMQLMLEANLKDNEYFFFLMAEMFRGFGEREIALVYYCNAMNYKSNTVEEKEKLVWEYKKKLLNEAKFFTAPRPKIIKPTKSEDEKNLVFDESKKSFVKIKN